MVAPPKTPPAITERLFEAVSEILRLPDVGERLRGLDAMPMGISPADTAAFFARERERWRSVIVAAGIKPE